MANSMIWGTPTERERRRRIFLSVWAYAYEFMSTKIVKENEFDHESRMINLSISTGDDKWDAWWKENFKVGRSDWVCKHPHKRELHILAIQLIQNRGIYLPNSNRINQLPKTEESNIGSEVIDVTEDADGDFCKVIEPPKTKEVFPQEEAA